MRNLARAVIYGKPRQRECAAVAEGLEALGTAVVWRNQGYFTDGDALPDVDVAVTFGQRLHSAIAADSYRRLGVPVLTVDLPPMRQPGGDDAQEHRALWLDRVNWMPAETCPSDRILDLGWSMPRRRDESGRRVLVCGQTEDDAAHGLGAVQLREWARTTLDAIAEFRPVTWRPHPRCIFRVDGFDLAAAAHPIETVLGERWWAVATINSTVGLTAIMAGIPVFCDPTSFYAELCSTSLAALDRPKFPTETEATRFFSRLAYVQWTFDELASGEAVRFALSQVTTKTDSPQMAA